MEVVGKTAQVSTHLRICAYARKAGIDTEIAGLVTFDGKPGHNRLLFRSLEDS
jgi:hypothetical protein